MSRLLSRLPVINAAFEAFTLLSRISPRLYLTVRHFKRFGYWPDLRRPRTLNEKIHWKKLHDRGELLALTTDKFAVRDYVRSKGLDNILIPLLWHGTDPSAIPFEQLPDSFVVKPNHTSGSVIVVRDKSITGARMIVEQAEKWMAARHRARYEWAYKSIQPLILIEEFKSCDGKEPYPDYKFLCYHGEPRFCAIHTDRFRGHRITVYDMDWRLLPVKFRSSNSGPRISRPDELDAMADICRKLSRDFDFVRVDLYCARDGIFFGELTHYPGGGFDQIDPPEFDLGMGSYWRVGA